jgi:hypothetical protein
MADANITIQSKGGIIKPPTLEGIEWATERKGTPGKLTFKIYSKGSDVQEGNAVKFTWKGKNVFYGYVFRKQMDKTDIMTITAYDQLRYFKNKETYVYEGMSAGELLTKISADFGFKTGTIENTGYKIPSRVEDSQTLFDIMQNALDLTLLNTGSIYVLHDDFGKLALKNLTNMKLNVLVDERTGENFDYSSSIDDNTYNKIKLVYDNKETGQRDVYITQDSNTMAEWGILQYYDKLQEGENGIAKAEALIALYNKKTRKLTIKDAKGDPSVRAGSVIMVKMDLGDVKVNNPMVVESCTHNFRLNDHRMTLKLRGGDISG